MNAIDPSTPWGVVLQLQKTVATATRRSARSLADEEALDAAIEMAASGAASLRTIGNLPRNRAVKHRARIGREVDSPEMDFPTSATEPGETAAARELATQTIRLLSPGEFDLFADLATGMSFDEVAIKTGVPAGTLKARASRARTRIRAVLRAAA